MSSKITISHRALNLFAFIAIVFILYIIKPLVMPLLFASILGVMIFPVQRFFEKRWKCNRLFATIFSIGIIFSITSIVLFIIFIQLQDLVMNSSSYSDKITNIYENVVNYLEGVFNISSSKKSSITNLDFGSLLRGNIERVTTFVSESGSLFSDIVLIPIYLFFFLYYRRFFRNFAFKLFKKKPQAFVNKMIRKIYNVQKNYISGLLKVMFIVGILNITVLLILGIEHAIFLGFFAALLILIPYIGVIIGALLPAVIALATKDSSWYAFGVVASFGFIQFLEGNFITPKITGSKVSINSFIAILSLIAFAMLWGIPGMIVALPITATLKIIFDHTPGYEPYGYVMGEPVDALLQSKARQRLRIWKAIRKKKLINKN